MTETVQDLPLRWDGEPVTWSPFQPFGVTFLCPPRFQLCGFCESSRAPETAHGRIPVTHKAVTRNVLALIAFRCPDCAGDYVLDIRTDETWDLDETDYTPFGSRRP